MPAQRQSSCKVWAVYSWVVLAKGIQSTSARDVAMIARVPCFTTDGGAAIVVATALKYLVPTC